MPNAFCQVWEESEAGWGQRPDGYSVHYSLEDAKEYVKEYLSDQKKYFDSRGVKGTPHEYTRPAGEPYECKLSKKMAIELVGQISLGRKGLRVDNNKYPKAVE